MKQTFKGACPLDCPDRCSWQVQVENQRVVQVTGAGENPHTAGFVCSKAALQVARQNSPDRITRPLVKRAGNWQPISWEDAYQLIVDKLQKLLSEYPSTAILHFSGSGAEGLLHSFDKRFFNVLGGVTRPSGNICWGSGYRAQEHDFGALYAHSWDDVVNSRVILLWGRDPAVTNQHLVPFIKEAKNRGAKVVVINPLQVESLKLADVHLAPRPGTDGALAMAMAYVLMDNRLVDLDFISKHVKGFTEYAYRVKDCTPEWAEKITGIPAETIVETALLYGKGRPASIFLGYGLQRYANGGSTIRAIDALAAITGNIGISGGGVNYAHQYWKRQLKSLSGQEFVQQERHIPFATMATDLPAVTDPPIKAIFVSKLNPINQLPDSNLLQRAFSQIDFKVVLDYFLNDTAETSDLFLPVTTNFEQQNVVVSSWNSYGTYGEAAVPPRGQAKTELEIFSTLAEKLGLGDKFGRLSEEEWLAEALSPLAEQGITLADFQAGPVYCPGFSRVAWEDRCFATSDGKYHLYSESALEETGDPLPGFQALGALGDLELAKDFPLQLMTPHPKFSLHSSFYTPAVHNNLPNQPVLTLHPTEARDRYLATGDLAIVETPVGQLVTRVQASEMAPPGVALILSGSWIKDGGGVNQLVPQQQADMGGGTAYYDCRCQVRKWHLDSAN